MAKCVKVIACYFGWRRESIFNTPTDMFSFIEESIENEINIENGIETDVILVNNLSGCERGDVYLDSFDGNKTKNGKIIVEKRKNEYGSFGSFYDIFFKYKNKYDYWFFCEDDVLVYRNNYMKDFVDFFNSDNNIGFVCLAPIGSIHGKKHSGGGCGLTSSKRFLEVTKENHLQNFIQNSTKENIYGYMEKLEVEFTNIYVRNGFKIQNHPNYYPLCQNYKNHLAQNRFEEEILSNGDLEFIYKVGN
jgi:hypothetical protein